MRVIVAVHDELGAVLHQHRGEIPAVTEPVAP